MRFFNINRLFNSQALVVISALNYWQMYFAVSQRIGRFGSRTVDGDFV